MSLITVSIGGLQQYVKFLLTPASDTVFYAPHFDHTGGTSFLTNKARLVKMSNFSLPFLEPSPLKQFLPAGLV